jgi:WD repeat-containing protein 23
MLMFGIAVARQRRQVMRLLANSEIGRLFHFATDDDEFEDEVDNDDELDGDFNHLWRRRRRRTRPDPNRFPKVPSDKGTELMNSGTFGSDEVQTVKTGDTNNISKKKKLARRILDRELATESYSKQKVNQRLMAQVELRSAHMT